jgi:hypothetical protein
VSVPLEELTLCVRDSCGHRVADETGAEGYCPSCLAFLGTTTHRTGSVTSAEFTAQPLRGLTTMPDAKCLGGDPSPVVDGLATVTEGGHPTSPRPSADLSYSPDPVFKPGKPDQDCRRDPSRGTRRTEQARTARLVTEYGKGNPPCA